MLKWQQSTGSKKQQSMLDNSAGIDGAAMASSSVGSVWQQQLVAKK